MDPIPCPVQPTGPSSVIIGLIGSLRHAFTRLGRRLMRDNRALVRGYFEHVYRTADPYAIADDPLEKQKRAGTLTALAGRRFARVLEIGGGEGLLAERLAGHADELIMVDLSRRALERARQRLGDLPNVHIRQLDIVAQPLPGTFDLIVCSEVLIYVQLEQLDEILDKIFAALAPGGHLLLVHSRSIHDDDAGLEYKDFGAKTVHGAFIEHAELETVIDKTLDMYRITLLRRGMDEGGHVAGT